MSGNQTYLAKKAYEIAYAIFRIVPKILDTTLAGKMTAEATEVLASSVAENYHQAIKSLEVLNYLVKFGIELNFISFMNGEVLMREIGNFQAAIGRSINTANEDINIAGIFSPEEGMSAIESLPVSKEIAESANEEGKPKRENSGMRQIAILDKVRQSGNCRLRDIQEILPDCSERTIRYDLEDLMERNIIERVGNGGPSVFYRLRQMA